MTESCLLNFRNTFGEHDAHNRMAVAKSMLADLGNAIGNDKLGDEGVVTVQIATVDKGTAKLCLKGDRTPGCNVGNVYLLNGSTFLKDVFAKGGYLATKGDTFKGSTLVE